MVARLDQQLKRVQGHHQSDYRWLDLVAFGKDAEMIAKIQDLAIENLKRVVIREDSDYFDDKHESPYLIYDFQETKTTWHPIEVIAGAGAGY